MGIGGEEGRALRTIVKVSVHYEASVLIKVVIDVIPQACDDIIAPVKLK